MWLDCNSRLLEIIKLAFALWILHHRAILSQMTTYIPQLPLPVMDFWLFPNSISLKWAKAIHENRIRDSSIVSGKTIPARKPKAMTISRFELYLKTELYLFICHVFSNSNALCSLIHPSNLFWSEKVVCGIHENHCFFCSLKMSNHFWDTKQEENEHFKGNPSNSKSWSAYKTHDLIALANGWKSQLELRTIANRMGFILLKKISTFTTSSLSRRKLSATLLTYSGHFWGRSLCQN